jgi:hypothetical protein
MLTKGWNAKAETQRSPPHLWAKESAEEMGMVFGLLTSVCVESQFWSDSLQ